MTITTAITDALEQLDPTTFVLQSDVLAAAFAAACA